jgi:hypothetical protein
MEGTAITEVQPVLIFAEESAVMMANGQSRNTSVSHIRVVTPLDQTLYDVLATALCRIRRYGILT